MKNILKKLNTTLFDAGGPLVIVFFGLFALLIAGGIAAIIIFTIRAIIKARKRHEK